MMTNNIALAQRLADAAGEAIRPLFRGAWSAEEKEDFSAVTEADRAAEAAMRQILEAERPGNYRFTLRRRAPGVDHPLAAKGIKVKLGDEEWNTKLPDPDAQEFQFERELKAGQIPLQSWMDCQDGKTRGAYYVTIEFVD